MFIVMQLAGAVLAFALVRLLYPANVAADPPPHLARWELTTVPDLDSLSIDQHDAIRLAAATLHDEFDDFFSTETIELYLAASYDQFADRAKFTNFSP